MLVLRQLAWVYFRCRRTNRTFLVAAFWKGASYTNCGSGFVDYFYGDNLIH
jgi:hypothetical protein